jgi:uncharacterized cupin superfamily protein
MNLRDAQLPPACDRPGFEHRQTSVREALGGDLIGCSLYDVDPGNQLWPYHFHWNNEEWLVVVAGTPTLRTPDGERDLRAGDVVGFVEEKAAHTRSSTKATRRSASHCSRRATKGLSSIPTPARSAPARRGTVCISKETMQSTTGKASRRASGTRSRR